MRCSVVKCSEGYWGEEWCKHWRVAKDNRKSKIEIERERERERERQK